MANFTHVTQNARPHEMRPSYITCQCQSDFFTELQNRKNVDYIYFNSKAKKMNYMFLRHRPRHVQPPHQNFFFAFLVFTLKNRLLYTSRIVGLGQPSFAAILFVDVDWLVRILKVKNFPRKYSDTLFYGISFQKITNKKLPAHITILKKSA